ncbi:hypothetical protein FA95DRAFT_1328715 [Auriscalpium vulgare]|uniref:Uncharacterized protein n=1 Tax=Auriscalpium vulgare TaxID=40419 RepID=A0ACB8S8L1_9AGAM|nr:hypothetical protein FA95DRAFT_1328715 [Auriscalpium vulgare]
MHIYRDCRNNAASFVQGLCAARRIARHRLVLWLVRNTDTTSSARSRIHTSCQRTAVCRAGFVKSCSRRRLRRTLPYLEAVCRESLRVCRKDISVLLGHPIRTATGDVLNSLYVPNGTDVVINILAVNCSTAIWDPDAEECKPEQWLAPLRWRKHTSVGFTLIR